MNRSQAENQAVALIKLLHEQFAEYPDTNELTLHREGFPPIDIGKGIEDETTNEEWLKECAEALS
tara:strand:- start:319 stop:513 length:195 start_codon:yes stop_codon:yes gene_type:complete